MIAANSCENLFGIPAVNGFLYPEIVNPMTDTMYLMKNFWHINNSGTLNSLANNAFENASLPEGYTYSPTAFNEAATQAKIDAGLAYYASYKTEIDTDSPQLQLTQESLNVTVNAIPDQEYTGKVLTPAPVVSASGTTLTAGTDYTVAYYANIYPGTAKVTITGKGNYSGFKSASFNVTVDDGWLKHADGKYRYYVKNVAKTGWVKDKNAWYYLGADRIMKTGWQKVGTKWYYLDAKNGDMKTGWTKVGGKYYYLNATNGDMATGWKKVGTKWYYLGANGDMKTGWLKDGGKWYYLGSASDGAMKTGTVKIGAKNYTFNKSGVWVK
jgi:glucan-binding YG repeat protein